MRNPTIFRKRVFDPTLRILHGLQAILVIGLSGTGWLGENAEPGRSTVWMWRTHSALGFLLIASFFGRILWGFIGPQTARWTSLWNPGFWGHIPKVSKIYLFFYFLLLIASISGLILAATEHAWGPLADSLFDQLELTSTVRPYHEYSALSLAGFVLLHIAGMIKYRRQTGFPVEQEMITGIQHRRHKNG